MRKVCVLLSTYNGEKYLREQIDSVLNQKDVDVTLCVRDDGSKDGTIQILREYEKVGKIRLEIGENKGYQKSFYLLLANAPETDYYAFCDQDDVWDDDKLISAVKMLEAEDNSIPLLYYSALKVVNKDLKLKQVSHKGYSIGEHPFEEAFMLSFTYGCTTVINKVAREKFLKYDVNTLYSHDNNMNMICSALGKTIFDSTPHINYRQHGNNCFGYPSSVKAIIKTLRQYVKYEKHNLRSIEMQKIKDLFYNELTPEKQNFCNLILNYRNSKADKKALLNYKPYKSKQKLINFYIRYLIKTNKL